MDRVNRLGAGVYADLTGAIAEYAKAHAIDLVLKEQSVPLEEEPASEAFAVRIGFQPVFYCAPDLDITKPSDRAAEPAVPGDQEECGGGACAGGCAARARGRGRRRAEEGSRLAGRGGSGEGGRRHPGKGARREHARRRRARPADAVIPAAPPQLTLARPVALAGRGLFFGREVRLKCLPAPAGHGIIFHRTDLPGAPGVAACVEAVLGGSRITSLGQGRAQVRCVEHLCAAASGLGIRNLRVEIDAPELPILDGSAAEYVRAFRAAGLVEQEAPWPLFEPRASLVVEQDEAFLALAPEGRGLTVSFTLDYGARYVGRQELTLALMPDTFVRELAPARTFALREEVQDFLARGLGGGATPDNVVIVEEDGSSARPLRFPDECVRHKIVDLLGDLSLLGARLCGRLTARRSGHAANVGSPAPSAPPCGRNPAEFCAPAPPRLCVPGRPRRTATASPLTVSCLERDNTHRQV